MIKSLLFVDHDLTELGHLEKIFKNRGYEIHQASNKAEALDILERHAIGLLLCNYELSGGEALELLRHTKTHYPMVIRFIMSGEAEKSRVLDAIGSNLARQYILKPWQEETLVEAVEGAFNLTSKLKDASLVRVYNDITELPTPPWVYFRIMQMLDDDASMADIAAMIEQDQAMTSKILRIANSAFFGPKTGFMQDAITYIGLINIKNIVLTSELYDLTDAESRQLDDLLAHAEATNKLMNCIYRKFLAKPLDNCYASAGLLHDIGKLLLMHHFKAEQKVIYQRALSTKVSDVNAIETELLGVDHQALGGYLLGWWQMPLAVMEAALYHHDPLNPDVVHRELVAVVHLADYYAAKHFKNRGFHEILVPEVFDILKIRREAFEADLDACPMA